ncbi:MAG: hypothetical protein U1F66_12630 [bacterium]
MIALLLAAAPALAAEPETPGYGSETDPPSPVSPPESAAGQKPSKKFSARFRSDFYSRYLWNGVPFSKGAVWQPSASVEFHGVGLSVWSNFVLDDEPNQGEFNEVDLSLYYRRSFGRWDLQASIIGLIYFNDDPASLNRGPNGLQAYFQVGRRLGPVKIFSDLTVGLLEPAGSVFWDLGVLYHKDLPLHFGLETSALFGLGDARFNRAYIADVGTQANLLVFSLAFPWNPLKGISFIPSVTVSNLLAPSLRRASPDPTVVWGGLSFVFDY